MKKEQTRADGNVKREDGKVKVEHQRTSVKVESFK